MGAAESEARAAFAAAHQQCDAVGHALRQLEGAGRKLIGPVQLRKLVSQATSIGTTNPQRFAEFGCTHFSDNAGAVVEPCTQESLLQLSASTSSGTQPWPPPATAHAPAAAASGKATWWG